MSPVDINLLPDITAAATKRFGEVVMHGGNQIPPVYRIPWDSLEMNLATYGGVAMGRMTRLWGGKSSCKSMLAWGLAKQAQQHRSDRFPNGLTVAYYNIEGAFDPVYVSQVMGVDIASPQLTLVQGGIIEDVSRNLDSLLHAINVHIIDSGSFATSRHIAEKEKENQQPGFDAKAWKAAWQSAEREIDKEENVIILIDQKRDNYKTGGEKAAGGNVADHHSVMTAHNRRGKSLYRTPKGEWTDTRPKTGNDPLTGTHRIDGYHVEVEIEKSRVCRPYNKAYLLFDQNTAQFDRLFELLKSGIFLGVIDESAGYYRGPTWQGTIHGRPKMEERLAQDQFLINMIYGAAEKYCREQAYGYAMIEPEAPEARALTA